MADKQTNFKIIHYAHNTHNHLKYIDAKNDGFLSRVVFFLFLWLFSLSFSSSSVQLSIEFSYCFSCFALYNTTSLAGVRYLSCQHLNYDKTICFIIVYQYGDLYCICRAFSTLCKHRLSILRRIVSAHTINRRLYL